MEVDKENINLANQLPPGKDVGGKRGTFMSLLSQVSDEMNVKDGEEKARTLEEEEVSSFKRHKEEEEEDHKHANDLQKQMDDEYVTWVIRSQEARLNNFSRDHAEKVKSMDEKLAHKLLREEEEELQNRKSQEKDDVSFSKAVEKKLMEDVDEEQRRRKMEESDQKLARKLQRQWSKEVDEKEGEKEREDFTIAKEVEDKWMEDEKEREERDMKVARNMEKNSQREGHRSSSSSSYSHLRRRSSSRSSDLPDEKMVEELELVSKEWEDPPLKVDDVHSGFDEYFVVVCWLISLSKKIK